MGLLGVHWISIRFRRKSYSIDSLKLRVVRVYSITLCRKVSLRVGMLFYGAKLNAICAGFIMTIRNATLQILLTVNREKETSCGRIKYSFQIRGT
jgi:hypothetical protein